jgi:hypothetical protein
MDGTQVETVAGPQAGSGLHLARRVTDGDGIDGIVARLRDIAAALPRHQATISDGEAWASYDVAAAELYAAIVALEELHGLAGADEVRSA